MHRAGSYIYAQVHVKAGAPSYDFTLLVYYSGSFADAWQWWLGGILFFTLTFCVTKWLLCPGLGVYVLYYQSQVNLRALLVQKYKC